MRWASYTECARAHTARAQALAEAAVAAVRAGPARASGLWEARLRGAERRPADALDLLGGVGTSPSGWDLARARVHAGAHPASGKPAFVALNGGRWLHSASYTACRVCIQPSASWVTLADAAAAANSGPAGPAVAAQPAVAGAVRVSALAPGSGGHGGVVCYMGDNGEGHDCGTGRRSVAGNRRPRGVHPTIGANGGCSRQPAPRAQALKVFLRLLAGRPLRSWRDLRGGRGVALVPGSSGLPCHCEVVWGGLARFGW